MTPKLDLIEGETYKVVLFPRERDAKVQYIGEANGNYVFHRKEEVILVDKSDAVRDGIVITHNPDSEVHVRCIPTEAIYEESDRNSRLINLLENAKKRGRRA